MKNLVVTKKSGNFEKELCVTIVNEIIKLRKEKLTIVEIAKKVNIGINKTKKILQENNISTKRVR